MTKKSLLLSAVFLFLFQTSASAQPCLTDSLLNTGASGGDGVSHGVFMTSAKWLPGQTLRVRFLDRSAYFEAKVRQHAGEWEKHANIRFAFVESGPAEIRISFRLQRGAYWSLVGKESRNFSFAGDGANGIRGYPGDDGVSMNLGWPDGLRDEEEIRSTTLHEFGHALGLLHEHQNANRPFEWNEDAVMTTFRRLGMSRESIRRNILDYYGGGSKYTNKAYDPYSIMHYRIDAHLTRNGFSVGNNTHLSAGDRALIREMYPPTDVTPFSFNDISVAHNVYEGSEKGMKITVDFTIRGQYRQPHQMVAYFYYADGSALKDFNQKFHTKSGYVSASKDFTPSFENARFRTFTVFMPYSELHMNCGESRLKFYFNVWKGGTFAAKSGYSYFTYRRPCPATTTRPSGDTIKHGPVELPTQNYWTADRQHTLKLKAAVVTTNDKAALSKRVGELMSQPGSHVWDNNWYYYRLSAGRHLLLAWKDLQAGTSGWVLAQRHDGAWWFMTNSSGWAKLSGEAREPFWHVGGGKVVLGVKAPSLTGSWTANDIMYRFAN